MSDEKIVALIADARQRVRDGNIEAAFLVMTSLADALEASVQAPADSECGDYPAPCNCDDPSTHDREVRQAPAVDRALFVHMVEAWQKFSTDGGDLLDMMEGGGILQDAAEVKAEALEEFANIVDDWDSLTFQAASDALGNVIVAARARAQQLRESTPEVPNEGNTTNG